MFRVRLLLFLGWLAKRLWTSLPSARAWATIDDPVSWTPVWLEGGDPFANHPFASDPGANFRSVSESP